MEIEEQIALIESKGWDVHIFGGNCPVQVDARSPGKFLYFRARGNSWDITIATTEDDATMGRESSPNTLYYAGGTYGKANAFDAGYMPLCNVTGIVLEAIAAVDHGSLPEVE